MGRSIPVLRHLLVVLAGVLWVGVEPAPAGVMEVEQLVNPLIVYETELLGLGDFDPTALVVTDDELFDSGASATDQMTLHDPGLLFVDDDRVQCPHAQFTSIQAAVLAAPPGGKIKVCPGEYQESVTISKTLTLQAPRQKGESTTCPASVSPDPTTDAILRYGLPGGNPSIGFNVQANGVVIDGFTIEPQSMVTANAFAIFTAPAFAGQRITHNVVQQNTIGVYLNSNGAVQTVVTQNCIRDNNLPGAASGVYSDLRLHNARIEHNYFTGHSNTAVVLNGAVAPPGVSDVAITHNDVIDDGEIQLTLAVDVVVSHNRVIRPNGTGIFLGGGVTEADVSFNDLQGGSANGISIRSDFGVPVPNENIRVKSNKISRFLQNGIRLGDGTTGNTVETNRIENNGIDGIRATPLATYNLIRYNSMKFNLEHDCHDDSVGPYNPPGLVANLWVHNLGRTQNRPGLCKRATTTP